MIDLTFVADGSWKNHVTQVEAPNSNAPSPSHRFLLKETQLSSLITSLLCNMKIDSTFSSGGESYCSFLFFVFLSPSLSVADQSVNLSLRQYINKTVWTTKICHTSSSISMRFDFAFARWKKHWSGRPPPPPPLLHWCVISVKLVLVRISILPYERAVIFACQVAPMKGRLPAGIFPS